MSDSENDNISCQEKINVILYVGRFDPKFTVLIGLGLAAAVPGGVGGALVPNHRIGRFLCGKRAYFMFS